LRAVPGPYQGKDERGVGYVKKNAIARRRFESWSALEAHLDGWMRDIADTRIHRTTGEAPIERFRRKEVGALRSIAWVPPFAWCKPIAWSRSTATPTRCRGG